MNSLIITAHYTGCNVIVNVGSCCSNTQKISRELVKVSYSTANKVAKSPSFVLRLMRYGSDFREVFSLLRTCLWNHSTGHVDTDAAYVQEGGSRLP